MFAVLKLIVSFGVVCGLIFLCSKLMQHCFQLPHYRTKMKILDQIKVSPKTTLSIVKIGSDYLLIGSSDCQCSLIKELKPENCEIIDQPIEATQPSFKSWNQLFEMFQERRKNEKEKK